MKAEGVASANGDSGVVVVAGVDDRAVTPFSRVVVAVAVAVAESASSTREVAAAFSSRRCRAALSLPRLFHFCLSSSVLPSPPTTLTPPPSPLSHLNGPVGISSPSSMCRTSLASASRFGPDSPNVQSSVPPYLRGMEESGMCAERVEVRSAAERIWILFRVPSSNPATARRQAGPVRVSLRVLCHGKENPPISVARCPPLSS